MGIVHVSLFRLDDDTVAGDKLLVTNDIRPERRWTTRHIHCTKSRCQIQVFRPRVGTHADCPVTYSLRIRGSISAEAEVLTVGGDSVADAEYPACNR